MEDVEKSITVNAPVARAYELWTHIEEFPKFIKVLREVRKIDEKTFYWKVDRDGQEYEAVAEVTLQIPERRGEPFPAWRIPGWSASSQPVKTRRRYPSK